MPWFIVKFDVLKVVDNSRLYRGVLSALSSSFINLALKEEGARRPENFHPISLCNFIYKIITKVITNLLKPLLPDLISPNGFVEGHHILDGTVFSHEAVHSIKIQKKPRMIKWVCGRLSYLGWNYIFP